MHVVYWFKKLFISYVTHIPLEIPLKKKKKNGPKTHKNSTKQSNSPRRSVLETKIGATIEILEVKMLPPSFEHFGQI